MEKTLPFTGILSNKPPENPGLLLNYHHHGSFYKCSIALLLSTLLVAFADFFNWNRVKLRYCDGASFAGDSQDEVSQMRQ